ncbi:MAG: Uma2 family endonuclease [Chloroflexota bacterium]|nr:Uma2 family endonuclease [Chloroflexota bacterium]
MVDMLTPAIDIIEADENVVLEVISRSSRRIDMVDKRREYELGGVPEYWMFNGLRHSATFLHLNAAGVYEDIAIGDDGIFVSEALPGFCLKNAQIWDTTLLGSGEIADMVKEMSGA